MQNLFLKKDYQTYLTVLLDNTSTGEVAISLNESTESNMGYLLLEPGTPKEESIFYHRREGNVVYCYWVNRDNPVEHLVYAVVYMANSIDYMNYIISQTFEQTFIYKKSLSHVIITGGSFYTWWQTILINDVDTSIWTAGKTLFANSINYIYLKDGDYFITTTETSCFLLIWKITTLLDGTISSIIKYNTVSFGETGPIWPTGARWATGSQGIQGIQWEQGLQWIQGIQGIQWIPWVDAPNVEFQYSINGSTLWHSTFVMGDKYIRNSTDGWSTWSSAMKFIGEDGTWIGDMLKSVYDPTNKNADAFSMDNMDETATKKILTDTERITIATVAGKEDSVNKGTAGWYASLDWSGKVPSSQLPSYVDDVLEYANLAAFPWTGTTGILYIAIDTGYQYRWTWSVYVEIKDSWETTTSAGGLINSATAKSTPVDADMFGLMDSAASNILKKLSWLNIKATLKTYFDTLYPSGSWTSSGINTGDNATNTQYSGLAASKANLSWWNTFSGTQTFWGTWKIFTIGDDAAFYDLNETDACRLAGEQNATQCKLYLGTWWWSIKWTSAWKIEINWVNAGTESILQTSQSVAYTLVLTDAWKHIYHPSADTTARTWTIPSNASVAFPIGTAVTFVNDTSAGTLTIAITTDTLVLAWTWTTGSRTLTANWIATAIKVTSTRWIISWTNLS